MYIVRYDLKYAQVYRLITLPHERNGVSNYWQLHC